jgi:arylformamidase
MHAIIAWKGHSFSVNLNQPLDISIPLRSGDQNPNAFGIQNPLFEPFKAGPFIGSVQLGGRVNCENLFLNAHGNGTHTECVGHISKEKNTINQSLKRFYSMAQLITVTPDEHVITKKSIEPLLDATAESLIIRSLPNANDKLTQLYSANNPIYLEPALCEWLRQKHIQHLIIDLPSVDPEEDGGLLLAHHAFWNYPDAPRLDATITEMAFIADEISDGLYLLNLQIASFESDASPSKPVLYRLEQTP